MDLTWFLYLQGSGDVPVTEGIGTWSFYTPLCGCEQYLPGGCGLLVGPPVGERIGVWVKSQRSGLLGLMVGFTNQNVFI